MGGPWPGCRQDGAVSVAYAVEMAEPHPSPDRGESPDRRVGARRLEVLRLVRVARDGLGVRALAESTGMHENTIRFHLNRLVEDGLVERRKVAAGTPGRPPLRFVASSGGMDEEPGNYALIARVLSEGLAGATDDIEGTAVEFGRRWGRIRGARAAGDGHDRPTLEEAVEELGRVLEEAGFEPEIEPGAQETVVRIHNCPFRQLARDDQTIPCGVHRGIMEGVLEGVGTGEAVTRLDPWVTPHLCVARVTIS